MSYDPTCGSGGQVSRRACASLRKTFNRDPLCGVSEACHSNNRRSRGPVGYGTQDLRAFGARHRCFLVDVGCVRRTLVGHGQLSGDGHALKIGTLHDRDATHYSGRSHFLQEVLDFKSALTVGGERDAAVVDFLSVQTSEGHICVCGFGRSVHKHDGARELLVLNKKRQHKGHPDHRFYRC